MRKEYIPVRRMSGNVANGMNRPRNGARFGTVRDAFARDSAYYGEPEMLAWYIVASVNRDSDTIERSNWDTMVALLGNGDGVTIERASHWACGWVDYLMVAPNNRKALREAIYAHSSLFNYPILDDDHYSEIEDEDCRLTWTNCYNAKERIEYFRQHGFTSNGPASMIKAILRGDWYEAARMLNCPSDLCH